MSGLLGKLEGVDALRVELEDLVEPGHDGFLHRRLFRLGRRHRHVHVLADGLVGRYLSVEENLLA